MPFFKSTCERSICHGGATREFGKARRQRKVLQVEEREKTSEKGLKEVEMRRLPGEGFKARLMEVLTDPTAAPH